MLMIHSRAGLGPAYVCKVTRNSVFTTEIGLFRLRSFPVIRARPLQQAQFAALLLGHGPVRVSSYGRERPHGLIEAQGRHGLASAADQPA